MKILVWNINQRSNGIRIPDLVSDKISVADIVVLTEFIGDANVKNIPVINDFTNRLAGYYCCNNFERKECEGSNGILIAIKKELITKTKIISKTEKMNTVKKEQPNFLQVNMVVNGRLISVIGTRIRVTDYEKRREQLLSLIEHINTLGTNNIIVAGDFNNTRIHGDENADYLSVRESYEPYDTLDTYNYHIMKDDFSMIGMKVYTPEGKEFSNGFKPRNQPQCHGYLKDDHIIVKETKSLDVKNVTYYHDFIHEYHDNAWTETRIPNRIYSSYDINPPFPDHAILTAEVDFKETSLGVLAGDTH